MHNGAAHGIDGNMELLGSPDSLDSDFATPGGVEIMATSSLKLIWGLRVDALLISQSCTWRCRKASLRWNIETWNHEFSVVGVFTVFSVFRFASCVFNQCTIVHTLQSLCDSSSILEELLTMRIL